MNQTGNARRSLSIILSSSYLYVYSIFFPYFLDGQINRSFTMEAEHDIYQCMLQQIYIYH
uniref:Uncharacterized protein n=1 Tax=Rhizophora mucronata TaxID=61149 RepID=A0A2P2P529_RHIMU